jgi:ABC-type antimicrobial peptide transport system permease subunit
LEIIKGRLAVSAMKPAAIPSVIRSVDPHLPVVDLKTMRQQVRENVYLDRTLSTFAAAFAVLATLLSAIGLYGVVAYGVARRTRELGLRVALGARRWRIQALVLRQVGQMTLMGGAVGIAAALLLGRAARSLLFGVDGHDPWSVAAALVLLSVVALGAGYLPARRAARVDPMTALRAE